MKRLILTALLFSAVLALPIQADFIQCVATVVCNGSANDDVMIGSGGSNAFQAIAGNDVIFGGELLDALSGDAGNDLLFGGLGSDIIAGVGGDDIVIPGPDGADAIQASGGGIGNDTFIVLVGETVNCQEIDGMQGYDVLHLIGFGPHVAEFPYGETEAIAASSRIVIQDPIAGGYIFVFVEHGSSNVERINGLPSPNVTILENAAFHTFQDQNCTEIFQ